MSKIHLEIFDSKRKIVFDSLGIFADVGYLAGGTALALQLKHRVSYDFDVFINKEIDNTFRLRVNSLFSDATYSLNTTDQINIKTKENVNVSFIWYYFSLINPPIQTEALPLASSQDIVADKACTIGRRAVWRDYVDIYWLLKTGAFGLGTIIKLAEKKFKGEFSSSLFLEQLSYFNDVSIAPIEFYKSPTPGPQEIQFYLKTVVKRYISNIIARPRR